MIKISLIIPVYNVEKYVEKCILSCIDQNISYSDYEIIVVNDGTQDNSISLIRKIAAKYSNIKLIDKENGGLGSARNTGFKHATGEYVWFIDSDDWIEKNCLSHIISNLNEIDVLAMNATLVKNDTDISFAPKRKLQDGYLYSGLELYKSGYIYPYSGVPFYIFKYSFLLNNSLSFKEGIIYEDILFTAQVLSLTDKCLYIEKPYYYYFIRNNSITTKKITTKNCFDLLIVTDELSKYKKKCRILDDSIARSLAVFYRYLWVMLEPCERTMLRKEFCIRKYWLISIFSSRKYKYITYYLLIKFNIKWQRF